MTPEGMVLDKIVWKFATKSFPVWFMHYVMTVWEGMVLLSLDVEKYNCRRCLVTLTWQVTPSHHPYRNIGLIGMMRFLWLWMWAKELIREEVFKDSNGVTK